MQKNAATANAASAAAIAQSLAALKSATSAPNTATSSGNGSGFSDLLAIGTSDTSTPSVRPIRSEARRKPAARDESEAVAAINPALERALPVRAVVVTENESAPRLRSPSQNATTNADAASKATTTDAGEAPVANASEPAQETSASLQQLRAAEVAAQTGAYEVAPDLVGGDDADAAALAQLVAVLQQLLQQVQSAGATNANDAAPELEVVSVTAENGSAVSLAPATPQEALLQKITQLASQLNIALPEEAQTSSDSASQINMQDVQALLADIGQALSSQLQKTTNANDVTLLQRAQNLLDQVQKIAPQLKLKPAQPVVSQPVVEAAAANDASVITRVDTASAKSGTFAAFFAAKETFAPAQNSNAAQAVRQTEVAFAGVVQTGMQQEAGQGSQQSGSQGGGERAPATISAATGSTAQVAGTQAANSAFARILTHTTPAQIHEQVLVQIKNMPKTGASKIEIRLDPAELGKLTIALDITADGKTGMTITVDHRGTLELLQRDLRGLERALSDAGLTADSGSMNFNLRGGDQQGQGEPQYAARVYQKALPEEEPINILAQLVSVTRADGLDLVI